MVGYRLTGGAVGARPRTRAHTHMYTFSALLMHKNAQITMCKKIIRAEASSRNYQQALKDKKNAAAAEQQVKEQLEATQAQVERERTRSQKLCEGQEMHARALLDASAGKSVVDLATVLGVSPTKLGKVVNASKRGTLSTELLDNAATSTTKFRDKPEFLKRVAATLTPLVEHVCSYPKFKDGVSDSGGVASMILGKIARDKSAKCKRRLDYGRPKNMTGELDNCLKELAAAWRTAFRQQDRAHSDRILQLTLKSIPQRSGRVTQWLGPR